MRTELSPPSLETLLADTNTNTSTGTNTDTNTSPNTTPTSTSTLTPRQSAALAQLRGLVDERVGPIVAAWPIDPAPGESGRFHRYASQVPATARFSDTGYTERERTGGVGASRERAMLGALGEAIERYCGSLCRFEAFRTASYRSLDRPAVDPGVLAHATADQLAARGLDEQTLRTTTFHWTAGRSLSTGQSVLLPAHCVYLPFPSASGSPSTSASTSASQIHLRKPISSGLAAATGYRDALRRAVAELIEREAFVVAYLNQLRLPEIDLTTVDDTVIEHLSTEFERMGWSVTVLDATLDHPFRTTLVVAVNQHGSPLLSLGLNADADMVEATRGALLEAFQFARPLELSLPSTDEIDPERLQSLSARLAFWNNRDRLDDLAFWLEPTETVPLQHTNTSVPANTTTATTTTPTSIDAIRSFLDREGLDCYICDVTTPDVRQHGIRVLSASIPELVPLYLDEQYKCLGTERLYTLPVSTGYRSDRPTSNDLTTVPHPFL